MRFSILYFVTFLCHTLSFFQTLQPVLCFWGGSGQKRRALCFLESRYIHSWRGRSCPGFLPFRYMLSHINLSWLILHQIWEQFPGVLVKMRGTCYLPIILPRRQSVCLWHDWEPREIAWHHFNFWISRQREFGTGKVNSKASFIHWMVQIMLTHFLCSLY